MKFLFWRQEDTRSDFLKKNEKFWGIKIKKNEINKKKIK